ncbi:hypothetical protein F5877DRAFT_71213 [Lentinula edodes]|nr:hypothetical protein F5877DRAFT_71213 [Lentinula edodes]
MKPRWRDNSGRYVGRLSPTSRVTTNPPENFECRDSSRPVESIPLANAIDLKYIWMESSSENKLEHSASRISLVKFNAQKVENNSKKLAIFLACGDLQRVPSKTLRQNLPVKIDTLMFKSSWGTEKQQKNKTKSTIKNLPRIEPEIVPSTTVNQARRENFFPRIEPEVIPSTKDGDDSSPSFVDGMTSGSIRGKKFSLRFVLFGGGLLCNPPNRLLLWNLIPLSFSSRILSNYPTSHLMPAEKYLQYVTEDVIGQLRTTNDFSTS